MDLIYYEVSYLVSVSTHLRLAAIHVVQLTSVSLPPFTQIYPSLTFFHRAQMVMCPSPALRNDKTLWMYMVFIWFHWEIISCKMCYSLRDVETRCNML